MSEPRDLLARIRAAVAELAAIEAELIEILDPEPVLVAPGMEGEAQVPFEEITA